MRCNYTAVLSLVLFVFVACSKDKQGQEEKSTKSVESLARTPVVKEKTPEDILVEINGTPITTEEFLQHIQSYPDRMKGEARGREHLLNGLIDQILLESEAERVGLGKDPDYLNKFSSYKRKLLGRMLVDTLNEDGFEVSEQEAKQHFETHPKEFHRPERAHARHIQLATEKEAKEVLAEIRKGASFQELVKKHSQDTATASRGGDLGVFSRKQRPDLVKVAFSMRKPGKVKGPVKTKRGFHLLQLVRYYPSETDSFEKIKSTLISRLRSQKRHEAKKALLQKLREAAKIKMNREKLDSLGIATSGQ